VRRVTWIALPFALATVASTLAGGAFALRFKGSLETIIALSGGVVVAVALFNVLPEALDSVGDAKRVCMLVGAGFIVFFVAERGLVLHHRDEPEQARAHAHVGALGAAGLSAHSFVDGLGIGLAFGLDTATGLLVFVAVISHDFADGLNTVTFVLRQGDDRRRALTWLAVYAGFFLFMGATDLLPHAHEHPSYKRVLLTVTGFAVVLGVSLVAQA
jgi:zinc transporter ZupT